MNTLKAAVVGVGMGTAHIKAMHQLQQFDLVAICDINTAVAEEVAQWNGNPRVYKDFDELLQAEELDVISICTPNNLHAPMTIKAAKAGIKCIYCEKPIALNLAEAREMQRACEEANAKLIIGHQRRITPPFKKIKEIIDSGEIGDVYLIRGLCPGDCLSDGTHTVDTILSLIGDQKPTSIFSALNRNYESSDATGATGYRYGHPVEAGTFSIVEFPNDLRVEIFTGNLRVKNWNVPFPGWGYQDFEIFGTKGRIWRSGDGAEPPIRLWTTNGGWEAVYPEEDPNYDDFKEVYSLVYENVMYDIPHPMSITNAITTHEIVMGIYESARLGQILTFPIEQDEFPLQLMIDKENEK